MTSEELVTAIEPIWDALGALYEPAGAVVWLTSEQQLLKDERVPLNLIKEGRGDEVLALLEAIIDGVYS